MVLDGTVEIVRTKRTMRTMPERKPGLKGETHARRRGW